jgi:glutamate dehydrogenase (NAD(P)+)
MAWVMDTYSMHVGHTTTAVVTGKPLEMGGSLGRREATGRGVMIVTREAAKHIGLDIARATVAVQGFGNVGSVSADLISKLGAKIVAVTDWKGGVHNPKGLDVDKLIQWTKEHKTVAGFPGAEPLAQDKIFEMDVDVLIPAALEKQITSANASKIKAKIIAEGANGPTTPEAHRSLHERGVFVIPDILANAGGVTVSYFEWVQDIQQLMWSEEMVNQKLRDLMLRSFGNVRKLSRDRNMPMRTAALTLGVLKVSREKLSRGLFP